MNGTLRGVVGAIFFLLLIRALYQTFKAYQSTGWKPHRANVIAAQVESSGRWDEEGGPLHRAKIEYQYVVRGKTYTSSTYSYTPLDTGDYGSVARDLIGLRKNVEIDVYVNPRAPQQSVVVKGASIRNLVSVGVLTALLVVWFSH